MQKRKYQSNAERQKAYRLRNQIDDMERLQKWYLLNPNHKHSYNKQQARQKRKDKKMQIPFIAFDGEGVTTKDVRLLKDNDITKPVFDHKYTLLSSSLGDSIENYDGLSTQVCLDFLIAHSGIGIGVAFGFSYDVTMILRDIPESLLKILWDTGELHWNGYWIKWIPGKVFQCGKVENDRIKSIIIYDTFGFFQKSFIKALVDWGFEVPSEIAIGKENRSNFNVEEKQKIRQYNLLECRLLVEMMNKLRQAMYDCDFMPGQWHGAGAIAQSILDFHGVRYENESPRQMIDLFLKAYYGGRNQTIQLGEFDNAWLTDLNSAYPAAMAKLPSAIGQWYPCQPQYCDYEWMLYRIEWKLPANTIITPFPVRHKKRIYWPLEGKGWYWKPEVKAALQYYPKQIKILEAYCFDPAQPDKHPFNFIPKYYEQRKELIKQGCDAQLVLKLGLNALYGKVAQSIGKFDKMPPYQNFFWAGYITSQTRSRVFSLAMRDPKSIIAFSTDGIASSKQLTENSPFKSLGEWDVKEVSEYFIVQSGVYTYKEDAQKTKIKSRGFHSRSIDYNQLRQVWREQGILGALKYSETRFIGLGTALRSGIENLGTWQQQERELVLFPSGMEVPAHTGPSQTLRLLNPKIKGEGESYQMKIDWREGENGLDELEMEENL